MSVYKRHILPLFSCLFLGVGWSVMGQATISSSSVAADNSTVSVTFSEAVFSGSGAGALDAADFVLGIGSGTAGLGATTPTSISVSSNTYTLGVSLSGTPDGSEIVTISPASGAIFNGAGLVSATSQSNNTVTLNDQAPPIISAIATSAFSWGASLNATEDNSDGSVTVTTSGAEDGQTVTITLNTATYTANVTSNSATVTITASGLQGLIDGQNYSLKADISDAAGNAATQVTSSNFGVDVSAPSISAIGTGALSWGAYLNATEDNSDGTVTVTTSGAEDNQTVTITLNSTSYTALVSTNSATVTIPAADLQALNDGINYTLTADVSDAAGNPASQVSSSIFKYDITIPTVNTLTNNGGDNLVKNAETERITAVFSEAMTSAPTISIDYAGGVDLSSTSMTQGSDATIWYYDWNVPGAVSDGTATATVGGKDLAENDYVGATNLVLTVDNAAPTVNSLTNSGTDLVAKEGETERITAVFSEFMTSAPSISIDYASGTDLSNVNMTQGSDATSWYYDWVIPAGRDGTATSTVAGTDLAGNSYTGTTALNVTIDNTDPASFTVGAVTAVGNTVIANQYNNTNTDIQITVPIANAADLEGGTVQLRANVASGGFENLGTAYTILNSDLGPNKALSFDAATFEALSDNLIDGETIVFSAVITDKAGNSTTGTQSGTTITFDQALPTVANVTSTTTDGAYKEADLIAITVVFSEVVNVTVAAPRLTLETGSSDAVVNYSSGTGSNTLTFNYTISAGQNAVDLDYVATNSLVLAGALIRDAAGNDATLTLAAPGAANSLGNNKALIVDTSDPSVNKVSATTVDGSYKAGEVIALTVVFSEAVFVVGGPPQLTLTVGSSDVLVDYTSGSGSDTWVFNYTIAAPQTDTDGIDYKNTSALGLNGGTIRDAAGNDATLALAPLLDPNSLDGNKNLIVDTDVPIFSKALQYDTDGDGNIDEIVVEMNEAIDDASVDFSDFSLGSGATVDGFSAASAGSSANSKDAADNDKFITLEVSVTGTAPVTVAYADNDAGNDLSDIAGNNAANNASLTRDDQALPVITDANWQDADANGNLDRVVLTFSEAATISDGNAGDGFGAILINGGAVTIDNVDYAATGTTLTLDFTGDEITGTGITGHTISYSRGTGTTIKDAVSNEILDTDVPKSYSDGAKPVLLNASYKDINPVGQPDGTVDRVDVIYSEDITASTFEAGDWTFPTNGASFTAASAALNGSTVEITVTGAAAETTVFGATTILYTATAGTTANSITDAAATPNTALTSSATTVDDAAPPIMISAITGDANTDGTIDQIVVTFSEPVDLTNVDNGNFTLTESAGGLPLISGSYSPNNVTSVTLTLTGVTANNTSLTIDLNYNNNGGKTIIDHSGANEMWFDESITGSDGVGPTVIITATDGTLSTAGNVVNNGSTTTDVGLILTFTLSEPSSDFDMADVSVANGTISTALTVISSTVYTAHFAATREGLAATVDVTTGGFTDAGGTANNVAPAQFVWTLDIPMTFAAGSWVHLSCKDADDGQITVKGATGSLPTDGSGTYEYDIATTVAGLFDDGYVDNTSNVFSGLAAGTYYIGISDQGDDPDHFSYSDAITIREPSVDLDAIIGTSQNNILCYGEDVNSASITVTGGVGDITSVSPDEFGIMDYDISTMAGTLFDDNDSVQSSKTFNNLPAGTYFVGARRIINYDVSGDGIDNGVGNGDETGSYCESSEIEITITSPDSLTLAVDLDPTKTYGPLCYGESSGQITTLATGGTGTLYYSASLVDGAFNYNSGSENRIAPYNTTTIKAISGGSAGTWYVSVKDANDCVVEVRPDPVVASPATELSISSLTATDVTCNGSSNGTIVVTMDVGKEGAGSLTYSALAASSRPGSGSFSIFTANGGVFSAVAAGSYYIAVKDANNCIVVSDSRVNVYEPDAIGVIIYKENASCDAAFDGAINATVSGGVQPYSYAWERANSWDYSDAAPYAGTSHDIDNLENGYYRLTVTDAAGCSKIIDNNTQGNMLVYAGWGDYGGYDLSCYGDQNGNINLNFWLDDTEEQPNFNVVRWFEGSTAFADEDISNSTALKFRDNNDGTIRVGDVVYGTGISGLVTVTSITDANNLVLSSPQSLSNGTLLYFGVSITDAVVGTNLFYTDQDGTSDRNYYRRDQLGIPNGRIDNLGPGRYFAIVDNGLGCRKTLSYNVSAPDELLWASTTERPLLAAGVSAIDYITTTRDLNGSQYDINCINVDAGTPTINYSADNTTTSTTVDATGLTTAIITSGAQITSDFAVYHEVDSGKYVTLTAPAGAVWSRVNFASYGASIDGTDAGTIRDQDTNSDGIRDTYSTCNAINTRSILLDLIYGKNTVTFQVDSATFEPTEDDLPNASNLIPGCGYGNVQTYGIGKTLAYNISYAYTDDAVVYDTITGGTHHEARYYTDAATGEMRYQAESYYDFFLTDLASGAVTEILDQKSPDGKDGTLFEAAGLTPGNYSVYVRDGNGCSSAIHEFDILGPTTGFNIASVTTDNITCFGSDDGTAKVVYSSGTDPNHPRPADSIKWYKLDNGLDFDGINDHVQFPNGFVQTISDFTFEAWFKKDADNSWSRIMDFGSGTGINMFLTATQGTGGVPRFAIKASGGSEQQLTAPSAIAADTWVHYAVTINSITSTGKFYINGVLVDTNTNMTYNPSSLGATNANYLGKSQYNDGYLDGTMNEVRIWSTVRTIEEINTNINTELTGLEDNLFAYYPFNQGVAASNNSSITSVTDGTSSSLDGTLQSFTLSGASSNFIVGNLGSVIPEYTGLESIENLAEGSYKLAITDLYGCLKEQNFVITEPSLLEITETITDVACLADDEEDFGNALNFNATDNNRLVVADNNALDMTSALTVEAWVYPTKNSGVQTIVSKLSSAQAYGYKLTSDNGWSNVFFHLYFNTGNLNIVSEVALTPTMLNSWHHIAATYDGTNMKIFIDGIEAKSVSQTGNIKTNTNDLVIGAQRSSSGNNDSDFTNYFEGSLDEVRIWNVARSAAQINYTKEITLDGDEEGLVAYYQFNQGTAGGNNSGISSLTEGINSLNGAFPTSTAFALTGSTSNFVSSYDNTPAAAATSGAIEVVVTGGSSSYSYQWFKGSEEVIGQTTANLNTASGYPIDVSGEFTVVVTDNTYGCSLTGKFNVEVAATLSLTGIVTTPKCKDGTDGALDITPGGGTSYDYAWTKVINDELVAGFAETSEDLSGLGDGTYDVIITEQTSGCTLSRAFDVASPTTLYTIGIDITDATCQGDDDGILITAITADAGHPTAYDYAWYSGAVAAGTPLSTAQKRIYDLAPGPYTMEVTDDYGCVLTSTATVSEEAEITFSTAATTNVTCFEGADGAINIGLSGGNGPYTHVWYKDGDEIYPTGAFAASPPTSLTGLSTGVYKVIVQDTEVTASPKKASCSAQAVFNITEPEDFTVTATLVDPACQDGSSGQISVVVSGATKGSGYTYQWIKNPSGAATAAGTTATISGLTGDNPTGDVYQLLVTDGSGCVSDAFDYTLTSPTTAYDINASTTISEAVTALPTETVQSNVSCNGAADGYVEVKMTVDGGHPTDFDYAWYAGTSTTDPPLLVGEKNIYDLAPGQYTFQIIDFYGCTKDQTYTILEYPTMDISATAATQLTNSCSEANDAAIGISVSGGNTANYYYEWFKNDIIFDPIDSGWTDTALSTLASGLYKVRVTDEQGCTADKSFEITTPEPLSLSYTQEDNICLGGNIGAIEVEVFGGTAPYDYAWTLGLNNIGDTDILSNLTSDDYVLTVTDFAGCAPLTQSITIGGPTTTFTIGFTKTDLTCYESGDGTLALDLTLTGAHPDDYAISWYKGGNKFNSVTKTLSDLEASNYKVIMTDTSGCTKADSITLVQPEDINLNPVIDPLLCYDASTASIALNPTGGSDSYPSVDWSLAGTTVATNVLFADALASGDYNVLLRDSRGCQKDSLFKIVNPENMAVDTVNTVVQSVLCKGFSTGSIDFTVENGQTPYDYAWFQASSAYSTSEDIEDLAIGTYDLTVTDFYGCISDVFSFEITEPDNLYNINGDVSEVSCLDSSDGKIFISLEVLGASTDFTYSWNRNGALLAEDIRDLANLSAASYVFAATDNFGCTKTDTFALENPPTITALFDPILPSCYGDSTGSITVSAAGGWGDYEYDWLNPLNEIGVNDSVISNILSGNYLVKITDGAGCTKHFPVVLEGPDSISISPIITNNSCNATMNAGIAISVTGGTPAYSYQWLENGVDYATTQNIDSLTADNYELIVTDSLSCVQSSGIMEVITPDPLSFTVLSSQDNLCTNSNTGALFLQGSGGTFPYQYSIDGGSLGNASFFDGLDEGEHTFTINDTNNCSTDSLITVHSEYELIADFGLAYTNPYIDWPISFNDSSLATDITSWFWELGNGASIQGQNSEFTYRTPGLYPITLKITNEVGCEAIKIDTLIIEKGYKLTMPSAFTPNGDALNDVFKASHENIIQTTLQLYNKYGALVFESTDLNAEWNGDLKDTPLPQDSYLYVIEYVAESGVARTERGRFTLLR